MTSCAIVFPNNSSSSSGCLLNDGTGDGDGDAPWSESGSSNCITLLQLIRRSSDDFFLLVFLGTDESLCFRCRCLPFSSVLLMVVFVAVGGGDGEFVVNGGMGVDAGVLQVKAN